MNVQPPLFPAVPTLGASRKTDRPTSVAAAKAVNPSRDVARVVNAIEASGGEGTIDDVCALVSDRDRGCLSRRITDAVQAGLLADTGRTERGSRGRDVTVWAVVA